MSVSNEIIPLGPAFASGAHFVRSDSEMLLEKVSGVSLNYEIGPRRPGDIIAIYANNSLAKNTLGWETKFSLDEMMSTSWKWELKLKNDSALHNLNFNMN